MKTYVLVLAMLSMLACESKPKIIEATEETTGSPTETMVDESSSKLHKVVAEEILHTSRYTYMNVSEDGEMHWIAIPKKEVEKGKTYYYRGGLKKTNFKSVEHDRVFETVYLVSDVSENPAGSGFAGGNPHTHAGETTPVETTGKIDPPPGGITIAELIKNKQKYEGQTVRVKGRVVKLNSMIMNRNWVHLQDGSLEDDATDLTITTTENIPLGAVVAFEGKVTLNKDFGAGYRYDIIMEEAQLLQ
jgi:hypothetical protein